jgi:purine-binding chemotaxis protein CheW
MQLAGRGTGILVGAVVDRVSEVITLSATDIEDTPDFGDGTTLPYVLGIAKMRDGVRILIDPDCLFEAGELGHLANAPQGGDQP